MTPGTKLASRKAFRNLPTANPFNLFWEMPNSLFEDPFAMLKAFTPVEETMPLAAWTPPCDIYETEKEIILKTELPEIKREDVHITIENNVLTLRGERKFEATTDRDNYHRVERHYGEFMRNFTLPTFVDPNKVHAEFREGVLTLTLPKREEAWTKQIEVKVM
ncbi:MAG TPA: Hsp20/alpha crystallin family protein [Pyrinomonadaceae bacterium]|nr:Hsp20/alpha crystallin family protein [Pyrinomonadaceae bacterium]